MALRLAPMIENNDDMDGIDIDMADSLLFNQ